MRNRRFRNLDVKVTMCATVAIVDVGADGSGAR